MQSAIWIGEEENEDTRKIERAKKLAGYYPIPFSSGEGCELEISCGGAGGGTIRGKGEEQVSTVASSALGDCAYQLPLQYELAWAHAFTSKTVVCSFASGK